MKTTVTMETTTMTLNPIVVLSERKNFTKCDTEHNDSPLLFSHATLNDISTLKQFFEVYPSRSCDFSIGGILLWEDFFDYEFCVVENTLFLKGKDKKGTFFHMPLGEMNKEKALSLIREYCDNHNISSRIISLRECEVTEFDGCVSSLPDYLPDWREYMYNIEQFIHFSGKKMEKKRNHLNYFMNHYSDYSLEILDGTQTDELMEFNEKFNLYHKDDETFDYESSAIGKAIENYTEYPFFGILLRYEGNIIGYTFGEVVGDTFIIHAEKGDIEYRGVYQALSSLLSRQILDKYPQVKFLNREDDMGNEYLRQSKLSYHPTKFIAKWEISA